jgi:WD40 repeat protein
MTPTHYQNNGTWRQELAHTSGITALAPSRDSARFVSTGMDGIARVWGAATGELLLTYRGHTHELNGAAWSPDGEKIATGGLDRTVQVWDAATGELLLTYRGHSHRVQAVDWSPDGRWIASGGEDRLVHLWDAATGELAYSYAQAGVVTDVTFSPDGTRIASAGWRIAVWAWESDAARGFPLPHSEFRHHHSGQAYVASFSPDGALLASAGFAGDIVVQETESGLPRPPYRGHANTVCAIAWIPQTAVGDCGLEIASVGHIGDLRVWDPSDGTTTFDRLKNERLSAVAALRDGRTLLLGNQLGTLWSWRLRPHFVPLATEGDEA